MYKIIHNPTNIMEGLNAERMSGRLCDVVFKVGTSRFPCHRNVLTSASSYFDAMFGNNFKEREQTEIELRDIDESGFRQILDYIYCGEIHLSLERFQEIMSLTFVADFMGIDNVFKQGKDFLKGNLEIYRAFDMCCYFTEYRNYEMLQAAEKYIRKRFAHAITLEGFLELPFEVISGFVFDDRTVIYDEGQIAQAILKWIRHDWTERIQYFTDLAKSVRYRFINEDYKQYANTNRLAFGLLKFAQKHSNPNAPCRLRKRIYMFGLNCSTENSEWQTDVFRYDTIRFEKINDMTSNLGHRSTQRVAVSDGILYRFTSIACMTRNVFQRYDKCAKNWVNLGVPSTYISIYDMVALQDALYINTCAHLPYYKNAGFSIMSYVKETGQWFTLPPRPENDNRINSGALITDGRIFYVCGGLNVHNHACCNVVMYDPRVGNWQRVRSMPKRRAMTGGAFFNDKLYVSGGIAALYDGAKLNDVPAYRQVLEYNPTMDVWHASKPMINGRFCHHLLVNENKLWAVGGGREAGFIESYKPSFNRWNPHFNINNYFKSFVTAAIY